MGICWECGKEGDKHLKLKKASEEFGYFQKKYREYEYDGQDLCLYEEAHQRIYCDECFERAMQERKTDYAEYIRLRAKLTLERAIIILEKQSTDIYEYRDAINKVEQYTKEHPEKFDSAYEMAAAIILIKNGLSIKMQYKVAGYEADFYIPSLKIILEVDGSQHKKNLYNDHKRDIKIRDELGVDWEVVRISTDYIKQNAAKLVVAIKAVKTEKQKLRKQNHGLLPEWYSKREKATAPKRNKHQGDDLLIEEIV